MSILQSVDFAAVHFHPWEKFTRVSKSEHGSFLNVNILSCPHFPLFRKGNESRGNQIRAKFTHGLFMTRWDDEFHFTCCTDLWGLVALVCCVQTKRLKGVCYTCSVGAWSWREPSPWWKQPGHWGTWTGRLTQLMSRFRPSSAASLPSVKWLKSSL